MLRLIMKASICVCSVILFVSCDAILPNDLPSGTPLWARTSIAGDAIAWFGPVSIGIGCIYIGGCILNAGYIDFGNDVHVTSGNKGTFILNKFYKNGTPVWIRTPISASDGSAVRAVSASSDGVYIGGTVGNGIYDLGNSVTFSGSSSECNLFFAYYDNFGNPIWATPVNCSGYSQVYDIVLGDNCIYAVGMIQGTGIIDFGNNVQISGGSSLNAFLVKYDLNGVAQWARTNTGQQANFQSVAINYNGIYAVGFIGVGSPVDFGNGIAVTGAGSSTNPVIIKYSLDGDAQWAKTTQYTLGSAWFRGIAVADNALYAAGELHDDAQYQFGNSVKLSHHSNTAGCVLVKYDLDGNALWARTASGSMGYSVFYDVVVMGENVYTCGQFEGFAVYNLGNGVSIDCIGWNTPVVTKYNSDGVAQWCKIPIYPSNGSQAGFWKLAADDNDIYVAGSIDNGMYYFNDSVITNGLTPSENPLCVKYMK